MLLIISGQRVVTEGICSLWANFFFSGEKIEVPRGQVYLVKAPLKILISRVQIQITEITSTLDN